MKRKDFLKGILAFPFFLKLSLAGVKEKALIEKSPDHIKFNDGHFLDIDFTNKLMEYVKKHHFTSKFTLIEFPSFQLKNDNKNYTVRTYRLNTYSTIPIKIDNVFLKSVADEIEKVSQTKKIYLYKAYFSPVLYKPLGKDNFEPRRYAIVRYVMVN